MSQLPRNDYQFTTNLIRRQVLTDKHMLAPLATMREALALASGSVSYSAVADEN